MSKKRCLLCAVETDNLPKSKSDHINVHLVSEHGFSIPDIDVVSDLVLGIYSRLHDKCFPQTEAAAASSQTVCDVALENHGIVERLENIQMCSRPSAAPLKQIDAQSTSHTNLPRVKEEPLTSNVQINRGTKQVGSDRPRRRTVSQRIVPKRPISFPSLERPSPASDHLNKLEMQSSNQKIQSSTQQSTEQKDRKEASSEAEHDVVDSAALDQSTISDTLTSPTQRKQMFVCKKCDKELDGSSIRRHIAIEHLRRNNIYCSRCKYGTAWDRDVVLHHIKTKHKGGAKLIDKRMLVIDEIKQMVQKLVRKVGQDAVQLSNPQAAAENAQERSPFSNFQKKHRFYCSECDRDFCAQGDNARRHVARSHLKKNSILCSVCDYGNPWVVDLVETHIKNKHNGNGRAIDKRSEIMEEVNELMNKIITIEKGSPTPHQSVKRKQYKSPQRPIKKPKPASVSKSTRYKCIGCSTELTGGKGDQDRHLAAVHLGIKMLRCSQCEYGSKAYIWEVKKHIYMTHNGHGHVVDHRDKYVNAIEELRKKFIVAL